VLRPYIDPHSQAFARQEKGESSGNLGEIQEVNGTSGVKMGVATHGNPGRRPQNSKKTLEGVAETLKSTKIRMGLGTPRWTSEPGGTAA